MSEISLPALYKYLDVRGAQLTLLNKVFKHAKPSDFNDIEDMTVNSIFLEDEESAVTKIKDNFINCLVKNLNVTPTCDSPKKEQIACLQDALKICSNVTLLNDSLQSDSVTSIYDIDWLKNFCYDFIRQINKCLQQYRVLCVSELNNSEKMWHRYAQNHEGIVLRISPDIEKDSKFRLFRKVTYLPARPPLYASVLNYLESSLFGNQNEIRRMMLEKIIYTKTLDWKHEQEYRLAIPFLQGRSERDTLPYHSSEISELYLGANISRELKDEVISLARKINLNIKVFQGAINNESVAFSLLR